MIDDFLAVLVINSRENHVLEIWFTTRLIRNYFGLGSFADFK